VFDGSLALALKSASGVPDMGDVMAFCRASMA